MTFDQALILAVLAAAIVMFLWGRWRHDMVAIGALLACVVLGLVPTAEEAFAGFGHPAVITVAAVLVLSRGLQTSGAVDMLARTILPSKTGPTLAVGSLTLLAAVLSGFMNNVGALALLMPVALQVATRQNLPPGKVLMPLSFGSILGGMTTLIGTPPNLIVSGFRAGAAGEGFAMFDFTPVGLAVAATGILFIGLIGWRLVPTRERIGAEGFETSAYLTEARVTEDGNAAGKMLGEIERALEEGQGQAQIVGLVRNEFRIPAPHRFHRILPGDILVIEAEPEGMASALSSLGLKLEEDVEAAHEDEDDPEREATAAGTTSPDGAGESRKKSRKDSGADDSALVELAVLPTSALAGYSASDIRLRTRYGLNLLAVSRQGGRSIARLRTLPIRQGDVLLMQGPPESISEFASHYGCVPLAERPLRLPDRRRAITAAAVLAAAIAVAAFGFFPAAIAFSAAVLASMVLRTVPPRSVYGAIDWSVIVLLGALIPVAGAMETTGAADLIARLLMETVAQGDAVICLILILVVTMTLSDFMNNAATAAVMCPIAIGTAAQLGVNADPFLMGVAVGASCAFLTPIGHQNNTLILGPGGFRFGDYWRLGLPLEVIVLAIGVPLILLVWPL